MPRYVILTHDHPFLHWDFMLEVEGTLRTWRLLAEPAAGRTVPAESLPDHRLAYLDYQGPVSGGRGVVARWDHGIYTPEPTAMSRRFRLQGHRDLLFAELATGNEGVSWIFGRIEQAAPDVANESSSESARPDSTP